MLKKILLLFVLCFFLLTPLMALGQITPPVFTPQVEVPDFGKVGETITVERGTFASYIIALYNWGLRALVILAIVMIMIAGFRWLTAAGNASLITQAKDQITSALIGLLIGIGSYALLNFINPQLVSLRSLEIGEVGEGEGIEEIASTGPEFCEDDLDCSGGFVCRQSELLSYRDKMQCVPESSEVCEDKEYGDSCVQDGINGYCSKNKACISCAEKGTPCGTSGAIPAYACPNKNGVCGKDNGCMLNRHGFQVCAY